MFKTLGVYVAYYVGAALLTLLVSHFFVPSLPRDFQQGLQGLIGFCILWTAHKQAAETVRETEQQQHTA